MENSVWEEDFASLFSELGLDDVAYTGRLMTPPPLLLIGHLPYLLICHHMLMPLTLTLKIEATSFFEILLSTFQTTLSQLTPQYGQSEL